MLKLDQLQHTGADGGASDDLSLVHDIIPHDVLDELLSEVDAVRSIDDASLEFRELDGSAKKLKLQIQHYFELMLVNEPIVEAWNQAAAARRRRGRRAPRRRASPRNQRRGRSARDAARRSAQAAPAQCAPGAGRRCTAQAAEG